MDPSDVPSQSSIHSSRTFFDPSNIMGQTPLLHSPPLAHEHGRYGLPQMPSAFSVIGRRPGYPTVASHHHDYNTTLSHDPLMVSSANPGLPRSPTTTTGSWWRPPTNTQSMTNTDLFGNPLQLWLPHDQEHIHPHESLSYHNPQTYRNFDILNGSSAGGFYASASRFFPETSVTGHIPSLGKERSMSWEERLGHGHHGLMLDPSGNGFSPWQDIHTSKPVAEKQRRPSIEHSEEKRNSGMPNNRTNNFEDTASHFPKNVKIPNKYVENQSNLGSIMPSMEPRPHERPKYPRYDTGLPCENVTRTQSESNIQSSIPTVSRNRGVSPWKTDSNVNVAQYKRDSVISTPEVSLPSNMYITQSFAKPTIIPTTQSKQLLTSGTQSSPTSTKPPRTSSAPLISSGKPQMTPSKPPITSGKPMMTLSKPPITSGKPPMFSGKPPLTSIGITSPTRTPIQSGGKPPLLERFREAGSLKNDKESSSDDDDDDEDEDDDDDGDEEEDDDGSSEEAEDDDEESGSVSDGNSGDEMSVDVKQPQPVTEKVAPLLQQADVSSESDAESGSQASEDDGEDEEDDEEEDEEDDEDGDGGVESNDGNQEDSDYSQETASGKRKSSVDAGPRRKRRVVILNEVLMKIPLEKGWKRQTKLRPAPTGGALRGDVFYFAPCGKKLRTYPDVKKYLDKNGITDLDLTHFSFSMKLYLGEFLECTQGTEFRVLSEEEVQQKKKGQEEKQSERLAKMNKRKEKRKEQEENAKRAAEAKINRKLQRQAAVEAAKQAKLRKAQERLQQKLEKQELVQAAKEAKRERARMLAEQKKRSKEEVRYLKHLEKLQKLEKQKLEKEVKAQQLIEARKKKKEDVANAKYYESLKKAKERELRRQQGVLLKAQEKERLKEQKRQAKKLIKERKLEQKRREMILTRELKKPVEDMVLRDAKPLPELTRIKDLKISGSAFADLLMVQEFLHNFGESLDIDFDTEVPSMAEMQASLINENDEDVITPVCQMLLLAALDDPGVEGPQAETALGVKLEQIELNEHNVSEVLRLFILARNAEPNHMSDSLSDKPFTALSPSEKAASLAFICNELLCGRTICREIENNIENMSTLRHNKWIAEGNLRKLKALQQQKFPESKIVKPEEKKSPGRKPNVTQNGIAKQTKAKRAVDEDEEDDEEEEDEEEEEDDEEEDEEEEEEDEEEDEDDEDGRDEDDEDDDEEESDDENDAEPETMEEFAKQIKKLERKQAQFRSKLFNASHSLRALYLGQDRFRRMFWVLPYGGSVYIEGKETCESGLEHFLQTEEKADILPDTKFAIENIARDSKVEDQKSFYFGVSRLTGERAENVESKEEPTSFLNKQNGHFSGKDSFGQPTSNVNTSEPCPMKLLMQHVSSQGKNSTPSYSASTDLKFNNHYLSQGALMKNGSHSVISTSKASLERSPSTPWFSLVPRQPCDNTTVINCWMPNSNIRRTLDGSSPRKPGRPPKNPKTTASEIFPTTSVIQTTVNVTNSPGVPAPQCYRLPVIPRPLTLEEVRLSVMESLRQDPAPIPKDMQSGWWRITDPRLLKDLTKTLHQRGIREKMLHKNIQKYYDYTQHSCEKQCYQLSTETSSDEEEEAEEKQEGATTEIKDSWFPDQAFAANKNVLIEVEELEEKIFAASLQIKGWRLPPKASKTLSYSVKTDGSKPENVCGLPLTIAITRLAALEDGIERRYLKSPLRSEKLQIPSNINTSGVINDEKSTENGQTDVPPSTEKEEVITPALKLWRETVSGCRTPAQLYMCLTLLNECIAWDKSIMKVFCQMCRKGDNEELLLLCDGCDRGYHTYCCQPKLDNIPVGDWYCTDCIIMATGKSCCFVCRGTTEKLLRCTQCPRNYHPYCLDPPLSKIPRSWSCPNCKKVKSKSRSRASTTRRKRKKQIEESESDEKSSNVNADESRPHLNRKQSSKDMAPCRSLLAEMEKHEDAWPFLVPVNQKQFPEYYRIIESPMDFHTMKVKLRDFQYTCREEFATDTRLVFDNCNLFNEDDSEVGQAGKRLKKFFEKRWVDILNREVDDL